MLVFIDDILLYSKSDGDNMRHLRVVLQVLKEHQLFVKYCKCKFWLRSVAFFSHIISSEGVEVDRRKTEEVKIVLDHCLLWILGILRPSLLL